MLDSKFNIYVSEKEKNALKALIGEETTLSSFLRQKLREYIRVRKKLTISLKDCETYKYKRSTLTIRLKNSFYEELKEYCDDTGLTLQTILRLIVLDYINEHRELLHDK
ncbi:TPA: hypothetical protein ACGOR8_001958 [Streptococcus suis]